MTEAESIQEANNILDPKITKLIRDSPASSDSFGSHDRVANAISHMINNEEGGIAIALEGTWGSGKSTVVKLLDSQTTDNLFIFDAWAHEGDPLRRVFIESLIDFCLPQMDSKNKKKWSDKRDTLTKIIRRVKTETTPKSPIRTALAIGYTAGLPISVLLLGLAIKSKDPFVWWEWIVCGYVLLPLPYCLWIALYLWRIKRFHKRDEFTAKELGFFDFFQHKSSQTVKSDSIESVDTTSIEFQSYFTELMDDYLKGSTERKIVIVLDNLDRLPEDSALSIWSTLRVFMDCWENKEKHEWTDRSWLLVPYDRSAVNHLWGQLDNDPDEEEAKKNTETSPGTSAAFLDKTFQIRFEVPPLISADWKCYLIGLLNIAFADHNDTDEQHNTYRLSSLLAEEKGRPPTPRHLKLYVNDIGALRRQFHDKFPLHHLAYYTILRRSGVSIRNGLLHGLIPEAKYQNTLGDKITESLAAICFNTLDIDKALDLLLAAPIQSALQNGNATELSDLSKRQGFWDVAETAIIDAPSHWDGDQSIASAAISAILASDITMVQITASKSTIPLFVDKIMQSTHWHSLDKTTAKGLSDSLSLLNTASQATEISRVLTNFETPDVAETETETPDSIKEWVSSLVDVLKTCLELKHAGAVGKISTSATVNSLIYVMAELNQHASVKQLWSKLAPSFIDDNFLSKLLPTVSSPYWTNQQADAAAFLLASKTRATWKNLNQSINAALSTAEVIPPQTVGRMIDTLKLMMSSEELKSEAAATRKHLATKGFLYHQLHRCREESSTATAAKIIYELGMYTDPNATPATIGDSLNGHKWLTEIFSTPDENPTLISQLVNNLPADSGIGFLSKILRSGKSANLFIAKCYSELISADRLPAIATPKHLRSNWMQIRSALENNSDCEYKNIIAKYVEDGDIISQLQTSDFALSEVDLHDDLIRYDTPIPADYLTWLVDQLNDVSAAEWVSSVQTEDKISLLEMITTLQNKGIKYSLGTHFQTAIVDLAKEIITGTWDGKVDNSHWDSMISSIAESSLRVIGKTILDKINDSNLDFSREEFFTRYGHILAPIRDCTDQKNWVRLTLQPIVEEPSETGCQWIVDQFQDKENIKCYNRVAEEDRNHFRDRVIEIINREDEQLAPLAVKIARALSIEVAAVEEEPKDSQGHQDDQDSKLQT